MTLQQALGQAGEKLRRQHIESPGLTAEVLLRHVLQLSRAQLLGALRVELTNEYENAFFAAIERHLNGEPVAYITGHKEFFGLEFFVDSRVLIPRPETELLVELAISFTRENRIATVADIGTGSGAVAIALAKNLPITSIYATDCSADAQAVALVNCKRHEVTDRIKLLQGDLLEPLPEPVDLIVANLPYVRTGDIGRALRFEPPVALDGGTDGLDVIRRFCYQLFGKLKPRGAVLLEVGNGQSAETAGLLQKRFPLAKVRVYKDFAGIDRVVALRW